MFECVAAESRSRGIIKGIEQARREKLYGRFMGWHVSAAWEGGKDFTDKREAWAHVQQLQRRGLRPSVAEIYRSRYHVVWTA